MDDKSAAVKNFDAQMKEMMNTLEKYKQENQKIVAQKEKEIEQLRVQIKEQANSKQKTQVILLHVICVCLQILLWICFT